MPRSRLSLRGLLIAFLLLGLLAASLALTVTWVRAASAPVAKPGSSGGILAVRPAAPLHIASPDDVVISEFRSRGPSSNSHEQDEFVELFNRTGADIPIGGWSLSRSDCGLRSPPLTPVIGAGVILHAGEHYLIGGVNYSGAVTPDLQMFDIGLADSGGVALLDGALVVIDEVGTCAFPSYVEGTPLAPLAGNSDQSYDRNIDGGGICVDTGNNAADFFLRSPSDPQNMASPLITCGNATPTPVPPSSTPTATLTSTPTVTLTPTLTFTPSLTLPPTTRPTSTPSGFRRLTINEVGWAGTTVRADKWIELWNSSGFDLNLFNWSLETADGTIIANLRGVLPANGFYLLVHGVSAQATDVATGTPTAQASQCVVFQRTDLPFYDQVFTYELSETGQALYLINPSGGVEDTADRFGRVWPAGKLNPPTSMERSNSLISDTTLGAWFNYDGTPPATPRDCNNNTVRGSPKGLNWSVGKTATPSPTLPPPRKPTPRPPTPFAHMVINEFLPRAGTDWNQDGAVNVYDEFIEVKNLGPLDVDLKGWQLDDEVAAGSAPFVLPSVKLKPDQRAVFYGSQTGILLDDSGDSVRLINPRGIVFDVRTYGPVSDPDQSHCRIPDGYYWRHPCFPTPGLENSLSGAAPSPPPQALLHPTPCLLPDTVPEAFRLGECGTYGDQMWNRLYWDNLAGQAEFPVPDIYSKWLTIVE